MNFLTDAFYYSWISAGLVLVGGIFALLLPPSPRLMSFFGHFVAGVILAAVAVELVARMREDLEKLQVIYGFVIGAVFMLALRWIIFKLQKGNSFTLMIGSMIDLVVDGFLLAASFYIAYQTGKLFALTLAACAFFIAFFISTHFRQKGKSKAIIFTILLLLATMPTLGTILFEFLSENSLQGEWQIELLAFATAALFYLAIEELVKEAHEHKESFLSSLGLFIGFLLVLLM